jgi:hypothetical protein
MGQVVDVFIILTGSWLMSAHYWSAVMTPPAQLCHIHTVTFLHCKDTVPNIKNKYSQERNYFHVSVSDIHYIFL